MSTGEMREGNNQKETRSKPNPNSIAYLSGCSSVALWLVVGIVGTYILYGLLVWMTSTNPISALR
jgi:hypothetical protein